MLRYYAVQYNGFLQENASDARFPSSQDAEDTLPAKDIEGYKAALVKRIKEMRDSKYNTMQKTVKEELDYLIKEAVSVNQHMYSKAVFESKLEKKHQFRLNFLKNLRKNNKLNVATAYRSMFLMYPESITNAIVDHKYAYIKA